MADVAQRHTRDTQATAVLISLVQSPFAFDVPIAVIRRRWPRLYPYARSVAERLKGLAGGEQVLTPAGWPYRITRWLVARAIGAEPEVPVENAIRYTTETVDGLLRQEDLALVCGFFMGSRAGSTKTAETQRRRVATFKAAVASYCHQRHVDLFDREVEFARAGETYSSSSRDAAYSDLPTRMFAANLIAEHVLANLHQARNC